jgi:hypothetical protein
MNKVLYLITGINQQKLHFFQMFNCKFNYIFLIERYRLILKAYPKLPKIIVIYIPFNIYREEWIKLGTLYETARQLGSKLIVLPIKRDLPRPNKIIEIFLKTTI